MYNANMAQKEPLTLFGFHERFKTEEDCGNYLFNIRWPKGYVCPRCEGSQYGLIKSRNLYRCTKCRYQVSLTAGTVMHRSRTPLIVWFWAIFLLACDKRGHSALSISKELGVSYWVAWTLLQKIRHAMGQHDKKYKLREIVELDEAYFGSEQRDGKTGRGTGKSKVLVAVSTDENKKHAGFVKMRVVSRFDTDTVNMFVKENLEPECTVQTDGLNIYNALMDIVSSHERYPIIGGAEPLPWVHTIISNAKALISGTYHGLGPKHLQSYLDEYCYRLNRRFWEDQLFNRMLAACIDCETITFGELTQ
jgi:transposase-like protein